MALELQYSAGGESGQWVQAGSLPPLLCAFDERGRTVSATLYPNMSIENGQWYLDVNGPDPIYAATFAYGASGHLASVTLNNGLSMQLTAPGFGGTVQQSLYGGDALLASASAAGDTSGLSAAPVQLDAVATQLGLGADWAETLTFSLSASSHLFTVRNASGDVVLYLVDAGPFRVGYRPDGTAVFYQLAPTYSHVDDPDAEAVAEIAGVAPAHILLTADGATGMYNDRPAPGALFGAWMDVSGSARFGKLDVPPSDLRSEALSSPRRSVRKRSDAYVQYTATVCAMGECWTHLWIEWVPDPIGGGGPVAPPARGGSQPEKTGNQIKGDAKLKAATDRALNKAKEELKDPDCLALLNKVGVGGRTLMDVMRSRHYEDPARYLATHLTYVKGDSKACKADTKASTVVLGVRVAICNSFSNSNDGWNAVYLIHEMMHTLGYGEAPQQSAFPTSSEINQMVRAACGN